MIPLSCPEVMHDSVLHKSWECARSQFWECTGGHADAETVCDVVPHASSDAGMWNYNTAAHVNGASSERETPVTTAHATPTKVMVHAPRLT